MKIHLWLNQLLFVLDQVSNMLVLCKGFTISLKLYQNYVAKIKLDMRGNLAQSLILK